MKTTCGIYLVNKNNKLLILHPTNHADFGTWSIPKGEPDEQDKDMYFTALRELFEETGIVVDQYLNDFDTYFVKNLPDVNYKSNKKTLISFLIVDKTLDDVECVCTSMVKSEIPFPEVDKYKWIHMSHIYILKQYLHESQINNLEEIIKNILI